jgi:streptogramin lyase
MHASAQQAQRGNAMSSSRVAFKVLGAAAVLSAALATRAAAQQVIYALGLGGAPRAVAAALASAKRRKAMRAMPTLDTTISASC